MKSLTFIVEGAPVPKGRPRSFVTDGGRIGHYTPSKTHLYEEMVRLSGLSAMNRGGWRKLLGAVDLTVVFVMPIPKSWNAKRQEAARAGQIVPTGKPDLDNLIKAVKDGLNGVVWHDDAQVVGLSATKCYGSPAHAFVTVTPL
jgi:Holliday junction resolvase RusA-like endonuclease